MKILLIAFLIFISACSTPPKPLDPTKEISISGFAIYPPEIGNWYNLSQTPYELVLASAGFEKNETYLIKASVFQLPRLITDAQFLNYVENERGPNDNSERFKTLDNIELIAELNGAECVQYYSKTEDHGVDNLPKNSQFMLLENIGYDCKHPLNNLVGVNIEYSIRRYPRNDYKYLEDDAIAFFDSTSFENFEY